MELVVTDPKVKGSMDEMKNRMKEMAKSSGVAVSVKFDGGSIGGPVQY